MKGNSFKTLKPIFWLALACSLLTHCSKKNELINPSVCYLSTYHYSGSYTDNQTFNYTSNHLNAATYTGGGATYTYDLNGNIITINYNDGSVENFTYDSNNRKLQITNPNQYQLKYTYNSSDQMTLRQYYTYDSNTSQYVLDSYLTFEYVSTETKNWSTSKKYDAASNLLSTNTFLYDSNHNPWIDVWGTSSVETANNPIQQIYTLAGGDPVTTTIAYSYTNNGYPLSATYTTGSAVATATYAYTNCH